MVLALARYLDQERISAPRLLLSIARSQPAALCRAMRYARMVYRPKPTRLAELREIANVSPEIHDQCLIVDIFVDANEVRQTEVEKWQVNLAGLSPFDFLIYASLFAFEHLIQGQSVESEWDTNDETNWYALTDLIVWKLKTSPDTKIRLSEKQIGLSMAEHMAPVSAKARRTAASSLGECVLRAHSGQSAFSRAADQPSLGFLNLNAPKPTLATSPNRPGPAICQVIPVAARQTALKF